MIRAESEEEPYKTRFFNERTVSYSDNTSDKGGKGDGFRPHELLEAALASCINMSVRMYADNNLIDLDSVSTLVRLDRSIENEVSFGYEIDLKGNLSERDKEMIFQMVEACPVRKTLSSKISFKNEIENRK